MTEKPLHVLVAEAIGWSKGYPLKPAYGGEWFIGYQERPGYTEAVPTGFVPRFDTDWTITGPFIEQYDIKLERSESGWAAWSHRPAIFGGTGATPLVAVCNVLLALHTAGHLEPTT